MGDHLSENKSVLSIADLPAKHVPYTASFVSSVLFHGFRLAVRNCLDPPQDAAHRIPILSVNSFAAKGSATTVSNFCSLRIDLVRSASCKEVQSVQLTISLATKGRGINACDRNVLSTTASFGSSSSSQRMIAY